MPVTPSSTNIATDLSAWCRLLGLYDCDDLKDAESDTLRSAAEPARPAGPPRPYPRAEAQPDLVLEGGIPGLLAPAVRPARTRLTSHPVPATREGGRPGAVGAGAAPSTSGSTATRWKPANQTPQPKSGTTQPVTDPARPPESSRPGRGQASGTGRDHAIAISDLPLRTHSPRAASRRNSPDRCPLRWDDHHLAAMIIPGQSGTYPHLHGRVAGLLTESGLSYLTEITCEQG